MPPRCQGEMWFVRNCQVQGGSCQKHLPCRHGGWGAGPVMTEHSLPSACPLHPHRNRKILSTAGPQVCGQEWDFPQDLVERPRSSQVPCTFFSVKQAEGYCSGCMRRPTVLWVAGNCSKYQGYESYNVIPRRPHRPWNLLASLTQTQIQSPTGLHQGDRTVRSRFIRHSDLVCD